MWKPCLDLLRQSSLRLFGLLTQYLVLLHQQEAVQKLYALENMLIDRPLG